MALGQAVVTVTADTSNFGRQVERDIDRSLRSSAALAQSRFNSVVTTIQSGFARAADSIIGIGHRVEDIGRSASRVGGELTRNVTAPILAAGAAIGVTGAGFESEMAKITSLVGVNKGQVQDWSRELLRLGPEVGKSPRELAEALFVVTSAGARGEQAMETLRSAAMASAIGLGDTRDVARAVTSAVTAYGAENLSATRATEILTGAVRAGNLEASELAPVMGRILPIASELGIGFEEVAGQIAVMSRTGTNAAEATTALRAIMTTLVKPTAQAEEALAGVGLTSADLREAAAGPDGLIGVLRLLQDAFGGNIDEMAEVIPNVRALTGTLNVLGQDGAVVDDILHDVANSAGILEEGFATTSETAQFKFQQAMAQIQATLIELSADVLPVMVEILEHVRAGIERGIEAWRNLSPEVREFIVRAAAVAAAVGPVLLILGKLVTTIGTLIVGVGKVVAIIGKLLGVLKLVGAVFTFLLSPIGLIIAAIALLAAGVYLVIRNWDTIKAFFAGLWDRVREIFASFVDWVSGIWETVTENVAAVWNGIREFFVNLWVSIKQVFSDAWNAITGVIEAGIEFVRGVINTGMELVRGAIQAGLDLIRNIWDAFWNTEIGQELRLTLEQWRQWFSDAWNAIRDFLVGVWNAIRDQAMTIFHTISAFITTVWSGISSFLTGLWNEIRDRARAIFTAAQKILQTIWNAIRSVITSVWTSVMTFLTSLWNKIRSTAQAVFTVIRVFFTTVLNNIRATFTSVWNTISSFVSTVMNTIRSVITSVWNAIRSVISSVLSAIQSIISGIFNTIKSIIQGVWQAIHGIIIGVLNLLRGDISGAMNAIRSGMQQAWNTIRTAVVMAWNNIRTAISQAITRLLALVRQLPSRILGALGNVGTLLFDAGKKIIQGLINGITNMAGNVTSAVKGVISKARNLLPFSPAKEGPLAGRGSTFYAGRALMDMLAAGITKSERDLAQAVRRSVEGSILGPLSAPERALRVRGGDGGSVGSQSTTTTTNNFEINVTAGSGDPDEIARATVLAIRSAFP